MFHVVTGGAGFVGSHLVNTLVDRGERVIIIDNLSTGYVRNLEHAVSSGKATFVYADVALPYPRIERLLPKEARGAVGRVFHLASPERRGAAADAWDVLEANGRATMALIELAIAHGARFLFASSTRSSGGDGDAAFAAKRFGERAVGASVHARGLDGRIVRLSSCYGPGMDERDERLVPTLLRAARDGTPFTLHGTGRQMRCMTYVDDVVRTILAVMDARQAPSGPVEASSGEWHTVEDVARAVARISGVPFTASYTPGDDGGDDALCNPASAAVLGLRTWTPLDEGLRATAQWLQHGRLAYA